MFGESLPFVQGSDTSKAAADSMGHVSKADRVRVYEHLYGKPCTCDEVEVDLGLKHQTASARIKWLKDNGYAYDTGVRKQTRSKRMAAVIAVVPDSPILPGAFGALLR